MVPDINSPEEALAVALSFPARGDIRAELVKKLREEDMMGLECAETVQLEKLGAQDAIDGWRLARWIIVSSAKAA